MKNLLKKMEKNITMFVLYHYKKVVQFKYSLSISVTFDEYSRFYLEAKTLFQEASLWIRWLNKFFDIVTYSSYEHTLKQQFCHVNMTIQSKSIWPIIEVQWYKRTTNECEFRTNIALNFRYKLIHKYNIQTSQFSLKVFVILINWNPHTNQRIYIALTLPWRWTNKNRFSFNGSVDKKEKGHTVCIQFEEI